MNTDNLLYISSQEQRATPSTFSLHSFISHQSVKSGCVGVCGRDDDVCISGFLKIWGLRRAARASSTPSSSVRPHRRIVRHLMTMGLIIDYQALFASSECPLV